MLDLTFPALPGRPLEVLCIGAHCDDIEIGCGGTLRLLQKRHPDCRIHWFVLTSDAARRKEALAGVRAFVGRRHLGQVQVHDLPDGRLPAHFDEVKTRFEALKRATNPDLIFTHRLDDRHQDHRLVGEVTWQTFRDHLIWEYEIPKYEGDLLTPQLYVPLPSSVSRQKIDRVGRIFASQQGKPWFRPEFLEALMRLRGLECRADDGLAEAFYCRKLTCDLGSRGASPARPKARRETPTRASR